MPTSAEFDLDDMVVLEGPLITDPAELAALAKQLRPGHASLAGAVAKWAGIAAAMTACLVLGFLLAGGAASDIPPTMEPLRAGVKQVLHIQSASSGNELPLHQIWDGNYIEDATPKKNLDWIYAASNERLQRFIADQRRKGTSDSLILTMLRISADEERGK